MNLPKYRHYLLLLMVALCLVNTSRGFFWGKPNMASKEECREETRKILGTFNRFWGGFFGMFRRRGGEEEVQEVGGGEEVCRAGPVEPVIGEDGDEQCAYWPGSFHLNGRCVRFYNIKSTYEDAKVFCENLEHGGRLAEIRSRSDWDGLVARRISTSNVYLGATDVEEEGTWIWPSDNSPAELGDYWNPGEPNGKTGENCIMIYTSGKLIDVGCQSKYEFYCEQPHVSTSNPCAYWPGSLPVGGRCFKFIDMTLSWQDAQAHCASLGDGGTLGEIRTAGELAQLDNRLLGTGNHVWIGASDPDKNGAYKWASNNADANDALAPLWLAGQPSRGAESCASIYPNSGALNDLTCATKIPFLCQRSREDDVNPCAFWPGSTNVDGKCFDVINELRTWDDAQDYCEHLEGGGRLAEIKTNAEFVQLNPSLVFKATNVWIGATDQANEGEWIYPHSNESVNFDQRGKDCFTKSGKNAVYYGDVATTKSGITCQVWRSQEPHKHDHGTILPGNTCRDPAGDGAPWCYTVDPSTRWEFCDVPPCDDSDNMWSPGQPDNAGNNEHCAQFLNTGFINDIGCANKFNFLCERDGNLNDPCLGWPGSFYINNRCIKLFREQKVWQDAQDHCTAIFEDGRGSLADVTTQAEYDQLMNIVYAIKDNVWIGANDIEREGRWVWASTGAEVLLGTHWWYPNTPDNSGHNEDCGHFLSSGKINDIKCDNKYMYFCQYRLC